MNKRDLVDAVAAQVAALEPLRSSTDALRRSWTLTQGFKGKALALWIVSFALILAVIAGLSFLGGIVAGLVGGLDVAVSVLLALVSLLIYPLIACVFTLFYYDLRVRKEGFDLEVLSGQLGIFFIKRSQDCAFRVTVHSIEDLGHHFHAA